MLVRISTLQPWRGEAITEIRHPPEIEMQIADKTGPPIIS